MNQSSNGPSGILDHLSRVTLGLAACALLGMALVQAWQVWARYVLNDSPGWTEPVALLLMNTAMMCGAAVAIRSDQHFGFTLLIDALAPRWRQRMRILATLLMAVIGGALAHGALQLLRDDWDVAMAGAPLPEGLRYLPLCAGGMLIALFALERGWRLYQEDV